MNTINIENFDECLAVFLHIVKEKQGKKAAVSFQRGFLKAEEGYKKKVFSESKKKLSDDPAFRYSEWLMESINSNNLFGWRNRDFLEAKFREKPEESENLLRKIFTSSLDDEELFDEATKLWGKRYPIISYIFFLKDMDRYVTVRPNLFEKCFNILGIDSKCLTNCSWENFQTFCAIVRELQKRLNASGCFRDSVAFIDAHSFLWMMWMLNESEMASDPEERKTLICDAEGRVVKYYGTRYERSKKNRDAAIKEHGYKCKVCGFDFYEVYGELGKNYIEVHHIKPLYTLEGEVKKIDPKTDLICLCSNCHSMIHRPKGEPMTPDKLREVYLEKKGN